MRITEQKQGAILILKPDGPLVQEDAKQLRDQLMQVLIGNHGRFVLDMSAASYADSLGLESLLDITDELARTGQSLKLCATNKTLREVLELTGLGFHVRTF